MSMTQTHLDWWSCDGDGHTTITEPFARTSTAITHSWMPSRRGLLVGAGLGLVGWLSKRTALADLAITPGRKQRNVVVTVFLRGGADSMSLVVPYGEANYYRSRPNVSIPSPRDTGKRFRALDLDGFFGLHPMLSPLQPFYQAGTLAIVHGCGSQDDTRSHFEAMSAMERGVARASQGPSDGWIARHLASTEHPSDSPLRAVAFGSTMPDSLRGATHAVALNSLTEFRLEGEDAERAQIQAALAAIYKPGKDEVHHAGQETLAVLDAIDRLDPASYKPSFGATYPDSDLGNGLRQVACLVRADLGLEVACLDKGGWDTHVAQGSELGTFPSLVDDLGKSLAAFARDMGPEMGRVTVVVMSEFGRRLAENTGLGTDHGRGGAMFLMGGGVKGGKVHARWPGLEESNLDPTGDLKVTTDYRDVLGEVLTHRLGNSKLAPVFAGYQPSAVGVVR